MADRHLLWGMYLVVYGLRNAGPQQNIFWRTERAGR